MKKKTPCTKPFQIHFCQLTSKQTAEYSSNQKDAEELSQPPWSSNAYDHKVERTIQKEDVNLGNVPMVESDNRFNGSFFQGVQQPVIISNSLLDQTNQREKLKTFRKNICFKTRNRNSHRIYLTNTQRQDPRPGN